MIIKTATQLLNASYTKDQLLDFLMETEIQSFIPQLQEERDTYSARISVSGDYAFFFFDDNMNYAGCMTCEFIEQVPSSMQDVNFNHLPKKGCLSSILYISSFAINKTFRKKHLGKTIFNQCISLIKQDSRIQKTVLVVNEEWESAKCIYQNAGFIKTAVFEHAFPTKAKNIFTNGILMELKIL